MGKRVPDQTGDSRHVSLPFNSPFLSIAQSGVCHKQLTYYSCMLPCNRWCKFTMTLYLGKSMRSVTVWLPSVISSGFGSSVGMVICSHKKSRVFSRFCCGGTWREGGVQCRWAFIRVMAQQGSHYAWQRGGHLSDCCITKKCFVPENNFPLCS